MMGWRQVMLYDTNWLRFAHRHHPACISMLDFSATR